jgi:hypothetical protein
LILVFLICQIVAGFSDEFINLKGMVAFYAFMITALLGTCIAYSYNTKVAIKSNA